MSYPARAEGLGKYGKLFFTFKLIEFLYKLFDFWIKKDSITFIKNASLVGRLYPL